MSSKAQLKTSVDVSFLITDPERIPAPHYFDEDFYKLEVERLWPHVWQMACRLEQIQNVGDYNRIIDGYLTGVAPEKLAKANTLLGGNFDGKILDLGF